MTHTFNDFGLAEPVLKALASENYATPTPIQAKAIPVVLEGRDILGIAQTGTGKTAAFALPIIDRLLADKRRPLPKGCRALVLSPTRELASQIADSFKKYSRFANLSVATVFGGVGYNGQVRALSRGVDVLVATPGRLLDLVSSGHCNLSGTDLLVLDEADQMLDLGFVKPIRSIAAKTAKQRQSLFFSATFPKEIESISRELLHNPVNIRVTPVATTAERVSQKVLHINQANKARLLVELLNDQDMVRTLVFTRTKRGADKVTKFLVQSGIQASAIHGNKSQNQRERALDEFRSAKINVLVATDIAARGIDIPLVSHVVNHDLPEVPESYVHRIGRTARAGNSGHAITLCDPSERSLLREIERITRQTIASERITMAPIIDANPTTSPNPNPNPNSGPNPNANVRAARKFQDAADAGGADRRVNRGARKPRPNEEANGDGSRRHKRRRPDDKRSNHAPTNHASGQVSTADRGPRSKQKDVELKKDRAGGANATARVKHSKPKRRRGGAAHGTPNQGASAYSAERRSPRRPVPAA